MVCFPPWSGPGSWSCTSWRCAARGWSRTREALGALDRAETAPEKYPDRALCMKICGLVRRRLENPGYLRDPDYGAALMDVFQAGGHRIRGVPPALGAAGPAHRRAAV